jgi:hypothetical protein
VLVKVTAWAAEVASMAAMAAATIFILYSLNKATQKAYVFVNMQKLCQKVADL